MTIEEVLQVVEMLGRPQTGYALASAAILGSIVGVAIGLFLYLRDLL